MEYSQSGRLLSRVELPYIGYQRVFMTPERLHRIRAVYEAAVDSPVVARQALLERECAGDDALRQEVEQLLGAREQLPEWLSGPLLGKARADFVDAHSTITHPAPAGHVHFPPGAILAQRYRIVHLLGRGGMGEVYRADDLLLGQPVALKFLPAAATAGASVLSRFRNEVRTARQVSHPSVCRVYDIGEADGLTYLSMEYVDGEDLASLLRRIGKLPQVKGLEIARQLCAGLAAAHDKGVVHRDLKPANIMLDGKGHVRITDFGIAGMAEEIRDVQSGTPAYMSPEQLAGKNVTPRSDIYALGIVLCELLTGKRPPLKTVEPSITEMDPAVERVIRRCLEPDPQMRPGSALSIAAALPGGDPLAAALARGDTPAPEVVANAGPVEGLRPWVAVTFLAAVVVGLGVLCVLRQQHDLINQIPMENSSEVLAAKAREIARSFGYTERPVDAVYGWEYDEDYLRFAREQKNPSAALYAPYPPAIHFWYMQSPHYPNTSHLDTYTFQRETLEPGMQALVLDSEGRLVEFEARPSSEARAGVGATAVDWSRLFVAAGLDGTRFQAAPSKLTPIFAFDTRAGWTGSTEGTPQLRVEAAAFEGRPVSFRVLGPWARPSKPPAFSFGPIPTPIFILFMLALPVVAGLVAWRNVRNGRGDRRGAFRLASFLFLGVLLEALLYVHHVPTLTEFALLFAVMQSAVALGAMGWLLYMAFEPQLRKRVPESLISWNRLLAGRFRDPVVGGHLLGGIALGAIGLCAMTSLNVSPFVAVFPPLLPSSNAALLSLLIWLLLMMFPGGLGCSLLMSLISIAVQRRWLAAVLFVLLMTLIVMPSYDRPSLLIIIRLLIVQTVVAFTLIQFGVLATVAALYAAFVIEIFPLTTNWAAWYAPAALLGIATLMALALYGFVTTLSGRRLWAANLGAS
jgi:Protein kinase domain